MMRGHSMRILPMFWKKNELPMRMSTILRPTCNKVLGLFIICIVVYAYVRIKSEQYDGGKYSVDSKETRNLANFDLKPWQVEDAVKHGICGISTDSMKWGMVTLVKSAVANKDRRDVIRRTWGNICAVDDVIMRVVFVVGVGDEVTAMDGLKGENEKFGDILRYDKPDTARFVPEKILAGMQWATEILHGRWLYSSADDDILVHVPHLADYIASLVGGRTEEEIPLSCVYSFQEQDPPARDPDSKWFIPFNAYPGWYWPRYCRGGFYTMSATMNSQLFAVSRKTAYLHLDDVWITGFMRRRLGNEDLNIVAAPESRKKTDLEYMIDQDPKTVLVQHMWGNIDDVKVDVPQKLTSVWNLWKKGFDKSRKFCTLNSLWLNKVS